MQRGGAKTERFEIIAPLGQGGFGSVYEALDAVSGERVALKELRRVTAESLARFKQEFRVMAELHHPNLVGLKGLFQQDQRWYIAMEFVGGDHLVDYVRAFSPDNDNQAGYDAERLRSAFGGAFAGLVALHQTKTLHRDFKPSNVNVTPEGRAVLLDFGLVTSSDPTRQSTQAGGVGTAAYMAPEQAYGDKVGPAADWYAFGVCLFEALTGQLPFDQSTALALMMAKQTGKARRASELARVPAQLDDLCADLLERDPDRRPAPIDIARRLELGAKYVRSATSLVPPRHASRRQSDAQDSFAGREAELDVLHRALARTHEGEFRLVVVEGESGMGKTELTREFLRQASVRDESLLSLFGRCYENEQIAYKGFDGCIDELARRLRKLHDSECASFMPRDAALLGQLFPVLRGVRAVASAQVTDAPADPIARREAAFTVLAELLSKLAEESPLVLVLDDLQWADDETFRLLHAIVRTRPAPPVLFVATLRPRSELDASVRRTLDDLCAERATDLLTLRGLTMAQAETLGAELLGPQTNPAFVQAVAKESEGHPLFIREIARFTRTLDTANLAAVTLEAALRARIDDLSTRERELLELVALAGRPYPGRVFAEVLGEEGVEEAARPLLSGQLLFRRRGHELVCFHDRIREAALVHVSRAQRAQLHRRLAVVLASNPGTDAAELARHWELADEPGPAALGYEEAAREALDALAFTRALELAGRALAMMGQGGADYGRVLVLEAEAAAAAGQYAKAAKSYEAAASRTRGDEQVRLRSHAANQLLLSGQTRGGLVAARDALAAVGIALPLNAKRALLRFLWERLRHLLTAPFARLFSGDSGRRGLVLDVIQRLNGSIALTYFPGYLALNAQHLRVAFAAKELAPRLRSYVVEGWLRSVTGSVRAADEYFRRSRELAVELGDPGLSAWQALMEGAAHLARWNSRGVVERVERAHVLFQRHCPDQPRELASARFHLAAAWGLGPDGVNHDTVLDAWVEDGQRRGDLLANALLVGAGGAFQRHLRRDDPEAARKEIEATCGRITDAPFSFVRLGYFSAIQYVNLYEGGAAALRSMERFEVELEENPVVHRTRYSQSVWHLYRAPAFLAAAAVAGPEERPSLLAEAAKSAGVLCKREPYLESLGCAVLAQIHAVRGDRVRAQQWVRSGLAAARGAGVRGELDLEFLEGVLEGGETGRARSEAVLERLRVAGWQKPDTFLRMVLPLLPLIEQGVHPVSATPQLLLQRYEILDYLGSGGSSQVVEARDVHTGERIALKELNVGVGMGLERFKREFRALQDVHHPNLVGLHTLFEHEGRWYIGMDLIEGPPMLRHLDNDLGKPDEQAVRRVFADLAEALGALHDAGFVHRDVSPSNVRMGEAGRAVLLDFGAIARSGDEQQATGVGTRGYAAPEQLEGAVPAASADVYALGACLHQVLTGQSRRSSGFQGADGSSTLDAPSTLPGEEGSELLALANWMLDPSPGHRPGLDEVYAALTFGTVRGSERPSDPASLAHEEAGFWGRVPELAELRRAHVHARQGCMLVAVEGPSGVGKSTLAEEFLRSVQREQRRARVVRGRCYENEQLAFNGLDGAVDQLAARLRDEPQHRVRSLLPRRAALLAQLFPVLTTVPAIAQATKKALPADPAARRLAAVDCFVRLLRNLANDAPLVIFVDDVQWADAESLGLLARLLDEGTHLPALLLLTHQPHADSEGEASEAYASLLANQAALSQRLRGLDPDAAQAMAADLLDGASSEPLARRIALESEGHPLFLRELAEYAREGDIAETVPTLEGALRARIARLSEAAREMLVASALAGKPHAPAVIAHSTGRTSVDREALTQLLSQGLWRRRGADRVDCCNEHVRRAALHGHDAESLAPLARRLAEALEGGESAEYSDRARLWELAGDHASAAAAHVAAGNKAMAALAFGQAERHFRRALSLGVEQTGARHTQLLVQHGQSLVRCGRSEEAARAFQRAAERSHGEQRVRLRIWAAQHLIQGAQVEEGIRAASSLLGELGLPLPTGEKATLLRIGLTRLGIHRRAGDRESARRTLSGKQQLQLQALHDLSSPLRNVDYLKGSLLVMRYLRVALDAHDPVHTSRALAYEGLWRALQTEGRELGSLDQSLELARHSGDPAVLAEARLMQGLALLTRADFEAAIEPLVEAHDLLQTQCAGQPWLLKSCRIYLGQAWMWRGDFALVASRGARWLADARGRGDQFAEAAIVGLGAVGWRHLLRQDSASLLDELDQVMEPWANARFNVIHLGDFMMRARAVLTHPPGETAAWLQHQERRLRTDFLGRSSVPQLFLIAVNLANHLRIFAEPGANQQGVSARIEADLRRLRKFHNPMVRVYAPLFEGVYGALRGEQEQARTALRSVRLAHDRPPNHLVRAMVYLEGLLEGGEGGRAKREQTLVWLRHNGFTDPEAALPYFVPGCDVLRARYSP